MNRSFELTMLIALSFFFRAFAPQFIITQPGIYELGDDITTNSSLTDNIISIQSSNVILDLGQRIVGKAASLSPFISCIDIQANSSNITIKNGFLFNVGGYGININPGCSTINISKVYMFQTVSGGIEVSGSSGSFVKACSIKECIFDTINNGFSLYVGYGDNVIVQNCIFQNAVIPSNFSLAAIYLQNSTNCQLENIKIVENTGNSPYSALAILNTSTSIFSDIVITKNTVTTSTLLGIDLNGNSGLANYNNVFNNCLVINNSAPGVYGFSLQANSKENVFYNCSAIGNTGTTQQTAGFILQNVSSGNGTDRNSFFNCKALNNKATTGSVYGFYIDSSAGGILNTCVGSNNISTGNVANGLLLNNSVTGWSITDCQFSRNFGTSPLNSYGIRNAAGLNNLYTRTIGFNNNTTVGNQLAGVPSGSTTTPTAPASSNLAAVTGPWTNMIIAQ